MFFFAARRLSCGSGLEPGKDAFTARLRSLRSGLGGARVSTESSLALKLKSSVPRCFPDRAQQPSLHLDARKEQKTIRWRAVLLLFKPVNLRDDAHFRSLKLWLGRERWDSFPSSDSKKKNDSEIGSAARSTHRKISGIVFLGFSSKQAQKSKMWATNPYFQNQLSRRVKNPVSRVK